MRLIVVPGLLLQALTTRYPEPGMIEVAVAAFEEMHRLETGAEPETGTSPIPEAGNASAPPLS
jgi:uncharacterized protein YqhQ